MNQTEMGGGYPEIFIRTDYQSSYSKRDFIVKVEGNHWDRNYKLTTQYGNASIYNVPELLVEPINIGWNFVGTRAPNDGNWKTYGYGKYKFYESTHPNEYFYIDFTDCTYANLSPTDIIIKYVEKTNGSGNWYYAKYDQPRPYPWVQVEPGGSTIKIHEILTHFPAGSPDTSCFESPPNTDTTPPQEPTNLVIANSTQIGSFVNLTWNANSESDLNHYNVWRKCIYWVYPIDCDLRVIGSTSTNNFTDDEIQISVNDGTTDNFVYYVSAVDNSGNESNLSGSVSTWGESFFKMQEENGDIYNSIPGDFALESNYPNPFNPSTMIKYRLPVTSSVSLVVFDLRGNEVTCWASANEQAGYKQISWNGTDVNGKRVPAGIYIYKLTAKSHESGQMFTENRKMIFLK
ncbi:T9SS type A sorting domain-containing protein [Caldithrix abyssi]|nr:T9SS type A sorting domain-containing protein [Caldithrix abyssi]